MAKRVCRRRMKASLLDGLQAGVATIGYLLDLSCANMSRNAPASWDAMPSQNTGRFPTLLMVAERDRRRRAAGPSLGFWTELGGLSVRTPRTCNLGRAGPPRNRLHGGCPRCWPR